MNPFHAYKQQELAGWTRIDLLLALFDGAIERLDKAIPLLRQRDRKNAAPLLARASLIVNGLASGLDKDLGEVPENLLRLYEFVTHAIRTQRFDHLEAATRVLRTLREGFQGIRQEALQMERSGAIPPANSSLMLGATI
jgi:flagellar protein FliS